MDNAPAWLADLLPFPLRSAAPFASGEPFAQLAFACRSLGCRNALAARRGRGELLGIDMVHAAVDELLAHMALPRVALLEVAAAQDDGHAEAIVAGIARACRAHDVGIAGGLARTTAGAAHVSLTLVGGLVAAAPAPAPGQAVLALRGHGPADADFDWAVRRLGELGPDLERALASATAGGDRLGDALLVPQRSCFDVLRDPLRNGWPARLLAVGEGGLSGSLAAALPAGLGAELDLAGWQAPEPFPRLLGSGRANGADAAECSLGCAMLALVPPDDVGRWLQHTRAWNEPAQEIGRLVAGAGVAAGP